MCDVDGVFTLGTGVLFTLGTDCCSVDSSLSTTVSLNMSASCLSAAVYFGLRSMGALLRFLIAAMRSWAARRSVAPGSMAGILQCAGNNFNVFVFR